MTISNCKTTSSNHAVKLQMKNKNDIYYFPATARTLFLNPVVSYPQGVLTTLDDTSAATRIKYSIINKCHEAKNRRRNYVATKCVCKSSFVVAVDTKS